MCAPEESVDWQASAIAAEARVEELTEKLRLETAAWKSAHDESARLTGELFDATMELVELRPLAGLARKIGQTRGRALSAHLRASTPDYRDAKIEIEALLDQAAALVGKESGG
jgi:hypothetical protein